MESESRLTRVTVTYDPLGGESLSTRNMSKGQTRAHLLRNSPAHHPRSKSCMPCERHDSSYIYDLTSFFWNAWIYKMSFWESVSNISILYSHQGPSQSPCATLLWVGCMAGMLPEYPSGSPTKYWAYLLSHVHWIYFSYFSSDLHH